MTTRKCQAIMCGRSAGEKGVPCKELGKLNRVAVVEFYGHPCQPPFACCGDCAPNFANAGLRSRPLPYTQH
jgi:hypothetical protein